MYRVIILCLIALFSGLFTVCYTITTGMDVLLSLYTKPTRVDLCKVLHGKQ